MAEGDAGKQNKNKESEEVQKQTNQTTEKPTLFIILAVVNMLVVISIGVMLFLGRNKGLKAPAIIDSTHDVVEGLEEEGGGEGGGESFVNKLVPLETFLVNLSGSRGHKLVKVSMDLEVNSAKVIEEIDIRKPLIRDRIITILSSKTYVEISTKEGKEHLRGQIRDQVNLSLTHGQVKNVFFTEFIYN